IRYYPKLVSMVPFTPATGRRLLRAPGSTAEEAADLVVPGLARAREHAEASSSHLLFLSDEEASAVARHPGLHRRTTHQFRWDNAGYASFDAMLETFRAPVRKQIKRERRAVAESDLVVETLTGDALSLELLETMHELYVDTCDRKGSYPYLTRAFFQL